MGGIGMSFAVLALKRFQKDDDEQCCISVTYLQDLLKGTALRDTAELVERYVYEFK